MRRARTPLPALAAGLAPGLALALAVWAAPAGAQVATGPTVMLETVSVSGGGGTLTNPGSGATATADTTVGQPGPVNVSAGPSSGVVLEPGFWPTVPTFVPEPRTVWLRGAALLALAGLGLRRRSARRGAGAPVREGGAPGRRA